MERNVVFVVKPLSNRLQEELIKLREKRRLCWRGCIKPGDFYAILEFFEFQYDR